MVGRKKLVAVDAESHDATALDNAGEDARMTDGSDAAASEAEWEEQWDEAAEQEASRSFDWVLPALAILVVIGWTAFFVWVHEAELRAGGTPAQWSGWIVDWSVPVLLVSTLWLLAMRNSRREAVRFGAVAQSLSQESLQLEKRLAIINRELSLGREFIAAQSRDLESLGRVATERLSQHADRLQDLIRDNGAQVDAIGRVSSTALENMDRLRSELPVIANSARDVSSQIGNAGNIAHDQLNGLISGFERLNEFGDASGRQADHLRRKVEEAIGAFEEQASQLADIADQRFAALNERSAAFRAELDGREVDSLAAIRRRADALEEELRERREEIRASEEEAIETLRSRLATLRSEGEQLAGEIRAHESDATDTWNAAVSKVEARLLEAIRTVAEVDERALENARKRLDALRGEAGRVDDTIAERFATFEQHIARRNAEASEREAAELQALEERLAAFDAQVSERQEEHLVHVSGLTERGDALASRLSALGDEMAQLSARTEAVQDGLTRSARDLAAGLRESRELLDENGGRLSQLTDESVRLLELIRSSAKHSGEELPHAISQAEQRLSGFEEDAQALRALISEAGDKGAELVRHVQAAQTGGAASMRQIEQLEERLAVLAVSSSAIAEQAQGELRDAIAALEGAARGALGKLGEQQSHAIRALAERIGSESSAAVARAVDENARGVIEELREAAERASVSGRESAVQLRDQLSEVDELAANLERRVAHAREQAEEQVDNDFTRRMALIAESLNSNAIDIAKAFDTEVADTAWASYLRGDRGIFTRKAVRLLDNQESKAIAEHYSADSDFRETVNRYIHDFEAMLRSMLSTRDGHALAVTVLSSEVGKLYVVLAQAIDRLRA